MEVVNNMNSANIDFHEVVLVGLRPEFATLNLSPDAKLDMAWRDLERRPFFEYKGFLVYHPDSPEERWGAPEWRFEPIDWQGDEFSPWFWTLTDCLAAVEACDWYDNE
jgi:hypothetical protein